MPRTLTPAEVFLPVSTCATSRRAWMDWRRVRRDYRAAGAGGLRDPQRSQAGRARDRPGHRRRPRDECRALGQPPDGLQPPRGQSQPSAHLRRGAPLGTAQRGTGRRSCADSGWLPDTNDIDQLESGVRDLLGVKQIGDEPRFAVAARRSNADIEYFTPQQTAWLARVRILAQAKSVKPFDRHEAFAVASQIAHRIRHPSDQTSSSPGWQSAGSCWSPSSR